MSLCSKPWFVECLTRRNVEEKKKDKKKKINMPLLQVPLLKILKFPFIIGIMATTCNAKATNFFFREFEAVGNLGPAWGVGKLLCKFLTKVLSQISWKPRCTWKCLLQVHYGEIEFDGLLLFTWKPCLRTFQLTEEMCSNIERPVSHNLWPKKGLNDIN